MATNTYNLDPNHSEISFSVKHLGIATVRGKFMGLSGTATADPADPLSLQVEVTADVSTINTGDDKRDSHLRTAEFFDVEKFPTATFKSTSIERLGDGEYKVNGDLTLHGVTKPVSLNVEGPSQEVKDPWGQTKVGASATATIHRKEFGLGWNVALEAGGLLVGEDVKLTIDVQFAKQT